MVFDRGALFRDRAPLLIDEFLYLVHTPLTAGGLTFFLHRVPQQFFLSVAVSPDHAKSGRGIFHVRGAGVLLFPLPVSNFPLSINPCSAMRVRGMDRLQEVASRPKNPANNSTGIWLGSTSRRVSSRNTTSSSGVKGLSIGILLVLFSYKLVLFLFRMLLPPLYSVLPSQSDLRTRNRRCDAGPGNCISPHSYLLQRDIQGAVVNHPKRGTKSGF